jgi:hypothetical protein
VRDHSERVVVQAEVVVRIEATEMLAGLKPGWSSVVFPWQRCLFLTSRACSGIGIGGAVQVVGAGWRPGSGRRTLQCSFCSS